MKTQVHKYKYTNTQTQIQIHTQIHKQKYKFTNTQTQIQIIQKHIQKPKYTLHNHHISQNIQTPKEIIQNPSCITKLHINPDIIFLGTLQSLY